MVAPITHLQNASDVSSILCVIGLIYLTRWPTVHHQQNYLLRIHRDAWKNMVDTPQANHGKFVALLQYAVKVIKP